MHFKNDSSAVKELCDWLCNMCEKPQGAHEPLPMVVIALEYEPKVMVVIPIYWHMKDMHLVGHLVDNDEIASLDDLMKKCDGYHLKMRWLFEELHI